MQTLYLDQNHWIYLSQAAQGRPRRPEHVDALDVIRDGVKRGVLRCPLSAQHYMETLKRRDAGSRGRLGQLMFELSQLCAIAPPSKVVPAEIDAALRLRYGKPSSPRPLRLFGRGFGFAFGEEEYRFKLDDEAASSVPPGERHRVEDLFTEMIEQATLTGPAEGPVPGAAQVEAHGFGERHAEGERAFARLLADEGATRAQATDWLAASELIDILKPLNEAFERAHVTRAESAALEGSDGMTALLRDLPSRWVVHQLRRQRHASRDTKWAANDLNDLGALSVAVAYCDVVVTERQWAHLVRQADLKPHRPALMLSDLAAVPAAIV